MRAIPRIALIAVMLFCALSPVALPAQAQPAQLLAQTTVEPVDPAPTPGPEPTTPPGTAPRQLPDPTEGADDRVSLSAEDVARLPVASSGASRYGPSRNDPSQGIPRHAYSPFDRPEPEPACRGTGCDHAPGVVMVKLDDTMEVRAAGGPGLMADGPEVPAALAGVGIVAMTPAFADAQPPMAGAMVESPQGERVPVPDLTRWYRATLAPERDVVDAVEALSALPEVAWSEPDYVRKPIGALDAEVPALAGLANHYTSLSAPNDPLFAQQWHLAAANVTLAWDYLASQGLPPGGSRDVVVAVIDTGVDYAHPDLAANMWVNAAELNGAPGVDDDGNGYVDDIHGVTTVSGQRSGNPMDDHGHGTHVAGIIAAQANNGLGGVGVAPNVQIMAIKAAQYSGFLASSDIAAAIYYAVQHGADVINMSFGGYARSQVEEDALAVAFGQAVLVAAAGNDSLVNLPCPFGRDMYPAAHNWVLGVMASQQVPDPMTGWRAPFTNYDCSPHDTHEYELMAPGVQVWSTLPNEQYAAWSGTSMATPVVAGIAALARTRWSDKGVYSSRFIMGQIASNTSGGIGGVADAYAALAQVPRPELHYLEHWLFDTPDLNPVNDNDGIVDAGETVDLAIVVRNHWGKADPVTVTLEAWAEGAYQPDPYVTMVTDTVDYGAIGSFNWDDNGFIYDAEGVITGVRYPFRFSVSTDCPNDHVIPFRLTMTAGNGQDPDDPSAPYTFASRFFQMVQRGRELPRIMSEDTVLTKDFYWLVADASLVAAGTTVTVTEGAQMQFFSVNPADPYAELVRPQLQVEGTLVAQGTAVDPIEILTGLDYQGYPVQIRQLGNGSVRLNHVCIVNPAVGRSSDMYTHVRDGLPLDLIDHVRFTQNLHEGLYYFDPNYSAWRLATDEYAQIAAQDVSFSVFRGLGNQWAYADIASTQKPLASSLIDSSRIYWRGASRDTVFLRNYKQSPLSVPWVSRITSGKVDDSSDDVFINNAILNVWWDSDITHWMRFYMDLGRDSVRNIEANYWGVTSNTLISAAIHDFYDDFNLGTYVYQPILTEAPASAYPFAVEVLLSTAAESAMSGLHGPTPIVGAEPVTFTVTFNRDMDPDVQPLVSFGPDVPMTDYTVHKIGGGWLDPRTWQGTFDITPVTGDGYQLIRVAGAVAADDPWLVTGDDAGRFRFEVITSGTEAMNLQASGGEGYVDLMWTQTDFDLLAGFNLYRATTPDGAYTRLNPAIIPPDVRAWRDTDVVPGQPYYYRFTVVKSDMSESDPSNVATATPIDTIPPVVSHTPLTTAAPGLPLTIYGDVTDNVAVQSVTLYYRAMGAGSYASKAMAHTTGNRYSATIEGSLVTSPGIEYYLEASDGISLARSGRADYPHQVSVVDRPVVTGVAPNRGPAGGGTAVTVSGSNFKAGAVVTFGGAAASDVAVLSSSQITCVTPPHYPTAVDVSVVNPDAETGTLLRGYTFESDVASVGLPDTGGGQHAIVEVPLSAANVNGLAAADLTITFDSGVLVGRGARTGSLTPGWSVAANTATPDQVRLSMASSGGTVSGSGVLAYLEFEVVGAPGATTPLALATASLNDGAIPVETGDGSFAVDQVYAVAGTVRYWHDSLGVPGVALTLQGDRLYSGESDAAGAYSVVGAAAGDYVLTPHKTTDTEGISAYDGSQALQHAAGLITLTGHQATAADVNKSGAITSMDAFHILQHAVGLITLPFPGAGAVWTFSPPSRSYVGLASDQVGQDFTAILLGDISGNWAPAAGGSAVSGEVGAQSAGATLGAEDTPTLPGQQVSVPVHLTVQDAELYGADLTLTYDPDVLTAVRVDKGALSTDWTVVANLSTPGEIRIALAGAAPIVADGELLRLVFDTTGAAGASSAVAFTRADLNEGLIPVTTAGGQVTVYTPVVAAFAGSPTSGVAPLHVAFTDQSTGSYDTWAWQFGDGGTSDLQHPSHTYETPGVYTVALTVSGHGGSDTETKTGYITVHVPVGADFQATPTDGVAPLVVAFTNTSGGDIDTYAWNFGDGGTSDQEHPTHTYDAPGTYTVALTISGSGGQDTLTRTDYITVRLGAISGAATYWSGSRPVPDVTLAVSGDASGAALTDATGAYVASGLRRGSYTLTPSRAAEDDGAITPYDASLVLRHSAGSAGLAGHAATAADVTGDASISAYDASFILRRAAGLIALPMADAARAWLFDPAERAYPAFTGDVTQQDYTAILVGDVSGNWGDGADATASSVLPVVELAFDTSPVDAAGMVTVTVNLDSVVEFYSMGLVFAYDAEQATAVEAALGGMAGDWMSAVNVEQPGRVHIAAAGAQPISGQGAFLVLRFQLASPQARVGLSLLTGDVDEGAARVEVRSEVARFRVLLPAITN